MGAEEMLAEYLGVSVSQLPKHEGFNGGSPAIFDPETDYANKAGGPGSESQPFLRPFVPPPDGIPHAQYRTSHHGESGNGAADGHQQPTGQHQNWSSTVATTSSYGHHHPHGLNHGGPATGTVMYGQGLTTGDVQPYRYTPGVGPPRTQEEIWRDFMVGYGQPS